MEPPVPNDIADNMISPFPSEPESEKTPEDICAQFSHPSPCNQTVITPTSDRVALKLVASVKHGCCNIVMAFGRIALATLLLWGLCGAIVGAIGIPMYCGHRAVSETEGLFLNFGGMSDELVFKMAGNFSLITETYKAQMWLPRALPGIQIELWKPEESSPISLDPVQCPCHPHAHSGSEFVALGPSVCFKSAMAAGARDFIAYMQTFMLGDSHKIHAWGLGVITMDYSDASMVVQHLKENQSEGTRMFVQASDNGILIRLTTSCFVVCILVYLVGNLVLKLIFRGIALVGMSQWNLHRCLWVAYRSTWWFIYFFTCGTFSKFYSFAILSFGCETEVSCTDPVVQLFRSLTGAADVPAPSPLLRFAPHSAQFFCALLCTAPFVWSILPVVATAKLLQIETENVEQAVGERLLFKAPGHTFGVGSYVEISGVESVSELAFYPVVFVGPDTFAIRGKTSRSAVEVGPQAAATIVHPEKFAGGTLCFAVITTWFVLLVLRFLLAALSALAISCLLVLICTCSASVVQKLRNKLSALAQTFPIQLTVSITVGASRVVKVAWCWDRAQTKATEQSDSEHEEQGPEAMHDRSIPAPGDGWSSQAERMVTITGPSPEVMVGYRYETGHEAWHDTSQKTLQSLSQNSNEQESLKFEVVQVNRTPPGFNEQFQQDEVLREYYHQTTHGAKMIVHSWQKDAVMDSLYNGELERQCQMAPCNSVIIVAPEPVELLRRVEDVIENMSRTHMKRQRRLEMQSSGVSSSSHQATDIPDEEVGQGRLDMQSSGVSSPSHQATDIPDEEVGQSRLDMQSSRVSSSSHQATDIPDEELGWVVRVRYGCFLHVDIPSSLVDSLSSRAQSEP